jgi:hypothetical protein
MACEVWSSDMIKIMFGRWAAWPIWSVRANTTNKRSFFINMFSLPKQKPTPVKYLDSMGTKKNLTANPQSWLAFFGPDLLTIGLAI